ncbi:MAG: hypothetical protein ACOYLK_04605 [Sphingomonas sp.]
MSSQNKNQITFSVTRNDLLFNFAQKFEDVFRFAVNGDDILASDQGVRMQEPLGFDFQMECDPAIEILPPGDLIKAATDQNPGDYAVYVTLEDIALSLRRVITVIGVEDISEATSYKIDLKSIIEMGFYRGFVVRCFIARKKDAKPNEFMIWSKSQIVYQAEFIVKSTTDEALFEIAWTTFSDPAEKKGVLFYVDWISGDVSSSPHTDCFQVKANFDLKPQFKRLENNPLFGVFCIRMVAERIISDLAENTMRCANLDNEPIDGSLHEKMQALFSDLNMDFDALAREYQNGSGQDKMQIVSRLSKAMQRSNEIGQTLSTLKFGGYRKS